MLIDNIIVCFLLFFFVKIFLYLKNIEKVKDTQCHRELQAPLLTKTHLIATPEERRVKDILEGKYDTIDDPPLAIRKYPSSLLSPRLEIS